MPTRHVTIGPFEADITPGVVDAAAVELYTNGACWYFAWVTHQLTGFPIMTLGGYAVDDGGDETDEYLWNHAGVLTPDGAFLDVTGLHDPQDAMCQWLDGDEDIACESGMYPVDVAAFARETTWDPADVDADAAEVTRSLVAAVLAGHGLLAAA